MLQHFRCGNTIKICNKMYILQRFKCGNKIKICLLSTWGYHNCFLLFFFKWGLKGRLYLNHVSSSLGVALCDGLGVLELSL